MMHARTLCVMCMLRVLEESGGVNVQAKSDLYTGILHSLYRCVVLREELHEGLRHPRTPTHPLLSLLLEASAQLFHCRLRL